MKSVRRIGLLLPTICLLAGLPACQEQPAETPPLLLEEPSMGFLKREIDDAMAEYDRGLAEPARDSEEVEAYLSRARDRLNRVNTYYLPLVEARERTYNAYQLRAYGRIDRSRQELGLVEELLTGVAKSQNDNAAREMEASLAVLESARVSLDGREAEALAKMETLIRELNASLYKGRIVVE
jgi:hypothetical protein